VDALDLSRLQFALTAGFHFLFVVVTLGLAPVVAYLQTRWAATGNPMYQRLTRFWGQIYIVNYALGIVVGIILEFQFGLHWPGLMTFAGDVFGAPLAMETMAAFFLESTFLGLWIFGWGRLNRWVHTALIWLVVITAYLSMYFVMVANAFLQEPRGHEVRDGVARIDDVGAFFTNPHALGAIAHIVPVAMLTIGIVMLAICSWHFLQRTPDVEFFRRSLRIALVLGFVGITFVIGFGYAQFGYLTDGKMLMIRRAPEDVATFQEQMESVHGPGDWAPPEWSSLAYPVMEFGGFLTWMVMAGLVVLLIKNAFERLGSQRYRNFWYRVWVWTVPWPFLLIICGWLVREVGRQPWLVYEELTVAEGVAPRSVGAVTASLLIFGGLFVTFAVIDWYLIAHLARRGPHGMLLGMTTADATDDDGDDPLRHDPEHATVLLTDKGRRS